ncbi:MAG: hypothetical protein V8S87_10045 [Oscillospiraceae bacterium]
MRTAYSAAVFRLMLCEEMLCRAWQQIPDLPKHIFSGGRRRAMAAKPGGMRAFPLEARGSAENSRLENDKFRLCGTGRGICPVPRPLRQTSGLSPHPYQHLRRHGLWLKIGDSAPVLPGRRKERIRRKAKTAHMSESEFVRRAAMEREVVVIEGMDEILRELRYQGNNLNQLTVMARQGRISQVNLRTLHGGVPRNMANVKFIAVSRSLSGILRLRHQQGENRGQVSSPASTVLPETAQARVRSGEKTVPQNGRAQFTITSSKPSPPTIQLDFKDRAWESV